MDPVVLHVVCMHARGPWLLAQEAICLDYCRTEDRGVLREFAPAALLVTRGELEAGLRSNPNFPTALLEWLTKEAIKSHAASAD